MSTAADGRTNTDGAGPTRASGDAAALRALRLELAELRRKSPTDLVNITDPTTAALVTDATKELRRPSDDEGPWDVHVTLNGSPEDVLYSRRLDMRLRFDARWPQEPPMVRVRGFVHHPLLDEERGPPPQFYKNALDRSEGALRVEDVVQKARRFFTDPAGALDITADPGGPAWAQRVHRAVAVARKLNAQRSGVIEQYGKVALHKHLLDPYEPLHADWFAPEFWAASEAGTPEAWRALLTEHQAPEVYSVPLFTEAFCDVLVEEIFNFYASGLPAQRPNSMNNYGIILNDIGLEYLIDKLQALLQPLGDVLFPGVGSAWDGHHCFVVRYREGEDLGLDMHTDDSDVTFNVCLGLEFTGAGLQFCGRQGAPDHRQHGLTYQHAKGRCVIHRGTKRHGADDISSGERLNLILWNHSSTYRKSSSFQQPPYTRELGPPDGVCLSYTHDRDYGVFRPYPEAHKHFRGRGWCPPPQAEYDGFRPDSGLDVRPAGDSSKL